MANYMQWGIVQRLFAAAISVLMFASCTQEYIDLGNANDVNATDSASLVFEHDYISGNYINAAASIRSGVSSATDYVIAVFEDVGLAVRMVDDDTNILPKYTDANGVTGPFPNNDVELRTYALAHDNGKYPWHLLSVDKFELNGPGNDLIYGVATGLNNGIHLPPSPPEERYSMIFTYDITVDYQNANNEPGIAAALITTAVHELGHQRAGLTDAFNAPSLYHGGGCVMVYATPETLTPRFCRTIDDSSSQTTHCLQIFEANYDNF
ncbi:MAG: hypothetical protein IIA59_00300 [Candidatus Marinimicrobia bacterium]|nr:hypothetical protein [Candidatus Neomarinimicrobiota bacterium]